MENIFKELKKKIENYKKILEVNTVEVDNSEVSKIEDEIKTLKSKIDELNASMEGKSKIEKMKITLNVSSIESEISLKEMDLEEKKENVKNDYENKIKSHNSELEETKKDIENFITDSEDKIENNVKNLYNSILLENSHKFATVARTTGTNISRKEFSKPILLGTDLEEVKGYYDNIMKVELPNLENIRAEESNIDKQIDQITKKMNDYYSEADRYQSQGTQWALKKPITFFGNYDEDKADDYRDNMTYCHDEASRYRKMAIAENDKLIPLNKEKEKLKIKREAIENKIKTIDEMVDEMIKEVIKEELKKREIVIPNFVPVTKYFNAPDEVEE